MPFRTKETLEAWLTEFAELGYLRPGPCGFGDGR